MKHAILVIEDNPMNMELVTDVLEASGYDVLQASEAEQGIAIAQESKPNLILMDISLPGMDGLEATRRLKSNSKTKDIPIVVLSANAMKGDKERAISAGCDSYMTKPIKAAQLPATLRPFIRSAV